VSVSQDLENAFQDLMRASQDLMRVSQDLMRVSQDLMRVSQDLMRAFQELMRASQDLIRASQDLMNVHQPRRDEALPRATAVSAAGTLFLSAPVRRHPAVIGISRFLPDSRVDSLRVLPIPLAGLDVAGDRPGTRFPRRPRERRGNTSRVDPQRDKGVPDEPELFRGDEGRGARRGVG
jgi:hypothetical protein